MTTPQENQLTKIVTDAGLELSDSEIIKQSYLPFFNELASIKEEAKKINFDTPTQLDEKIARELRLRTVKVRTGSEAVKDKRKKIHLLRGNVEQSSYNLIKTGCELEEEIFYQVEKKRELEEAKRKETLKNERAKLLEGLVDNISIYPLGEMSEESFNDIYNALQLAKETKEREAKDAELKRIEDARIETERIEAQRLENEKLKKEAEEREAAIKLEREEAAKVQRLKDEQAKKEREAIEAKLKKEAEERAKAEAELKAKKDAEAKVEAEAKAKIAAETKARIEAEKKAAKAPDKLKLQDAINSLSFVSPSCKTEDAEKTAKEIAQKFEAFKVWALNLTNNL